MFRHYKPCSLVSSCLKSPTHCHPSLANFSTAEDRNRIGAISRKTQRRGVSCTDFDIDDLIDTRDRNLFSHITDPNHRLYHLLPPTAHWSYSLRKRQHGYQLPHIEYNLHKNSFINRSLYNLRWLLFFLYQLPYSASLYSTIPSQLKYYPTTRIYHPSTPYHIVWSMCIVCIIILFFLSLLCFVIMHTTLCAVCVHVRTVRSHCCGGHSVLCVSVIFL